MVKNKTIVVIDDEAGICDILKKLLEPDGYGVFTSCDPEEGIKVVEEKRPDCVLLDIKMPKLDGIDVLTRIKGFDQNIAVVMITGYGTLESAMESMKIGAFDYITKPFDLDYVKNVVERAIVR